MPQRSGEFADDSREATTRRLSRPSLAQPPVIRFVAKTRLRLEEVAPRRGRARRLSFISGEKFPANCIPMPATMNRRRR